jgi:hypothetical protein
MMRGRIGRIEKSEKKQNSGRGRRRRIGRSCCSGTIGKRRRSY